jgi:hypothetical protein
MYFFISCDFSLLLPTLHILIISGKSNTLYRDTKYFIVYETLFDATLLSPINAFGRLNKASI